MAAEPVAQPAPRTWAACAFRWHLAAFAALNLALNLINALLGRPWWAFWPLIVTAAVLGIHYLLYKATTVDEQWAEERVEELNLKSYDRGHIEELKSRYGGKRIGEKKDLP